MLNILTFNSPLTLYPKKQWDNRWKLGRSDWNHKRSLAAELAVEAVVSSLYRQPTRSELNL